MIAVAKMTPKARETAIGMSIRACTLVSRSSGVSPAKVVADVYRRAQGEGAIVLLDVKSGGEEELVGMKLPDTTHETGCHPHPVWSRDGSRVYFNSTDCGTAQLYAVDL